MTDKAAIVARVERLEAAIIAMVTAEFGAEDGHPFYGNQYSGSTGWSNWASMGGYGGERTTSTGHTLHAVEGGTWQVKDPTGKVVAAGASGGKLAAEAAYAGKKYDAMVPPAVRHSDLGDYARQGYIHGKLGIGRAPTESGAAAVTDYQRGRELGRVDRTTNLGGSDTGPTNDALTERNFMDRMKNLGTKKDDFLEELPGLMNSTVGSADREEFGDVEGHDFHGNQYTAAHADAISRIEKEIAGKDMGKAVGGYPVNGRMQRILDSDVKSAKDLAEAKQRLQDTRNSMPPRDSLRYMNSQSLQAQDRALGSVEKHVDDAIRAAEPKAGTVGSDGRYIPRGRTDESSYDYTDNPADLASSFTRSQLQEALDYAKEDGSNHAMLKFDYEEHVPVAAVEEALKLAGRSRRY